MPSLMRVEFSRSLRPNSPRLVLLIEIPDRVASELNEKKISLETRAYQVALKTTQANQSQESQYRLNLMSCTKGRIKNLESLGEPNLLTHDACRGWVIKKPSPLQELLDRPWRQRPEKAGS
jgi:hypothetical protein